MPFNPVGLKNLTKFTKDTPKEIFARGGRNRKANFDKRKEVKQVLKEFLKGNKEIPKISPLDVIRASMIAALIKENMEDASRYAGMLAEYEYSKLQRIETKSTVITADLSDLELQKIIAEEGLGRLLPSVGNTAGIIEKDIIEITCNDP